MLRTAFVPVVVSVLSAALLSACAAPTTDTGAHASSAVTTPVEVTATYLQRIMLPPSHVLIVRVEDVSLADAPARKLVEVVEPLNGRAPPYAVTLQAPSAQIDPRHTYAARAEIRDAAGKLRFTTDTRYSVLTQGSSNRADITLVAVP